MKLQRCVLTLLLGASAWTSGLAHAATPAPVPRPGAPSGPTWWDSVQDLLSSDALVVGKQVLLSLLLFLGGWLVAKLISFAVYRGLCRTSLDNKLAAKLHLGVLSDGQPAGKPSQPNALERAIARVVYYMLMLLVVVGVLQFAGLSQAAGPIQGLVDTVIQALPLVGKAALIVVIAYFAGLILSRLVGAAISGLRLDARFAELSSPDQPAADAPAADAKPFSRAAGDIVFWLVMVAGLAGAFDALHITPISEPLHNALDRVIAVVPSLGFAALLVLAGYVLGRVVRVVLHNLLDSLGFNRLVDRLGLGKLFGHTRPSAVVGLLAMAFIVFQTSVAALNELGLVTLSGPLTAMMARFWLLLPNLAVSALVVFAGVFIGRLLRGAAAATLKNLGFDDLAARLGFPALSPRADNLERPSELVGFLVQLAVILLATAQACDNLELDTWSHYLNGFLGYLLKHVLVAVAIVGVGVAIGNYVRDLVRARSAAPGETQSRWLGEFARYAVLVFAFTMAVHQLDVAPEFVLLAFGLLFGGLCLAMALAFGLGGRDVAGDIVRRSVDQAAPPPAKTPGQGDGGFPRLPQR
ncbi:mechanosensitive ion channel [Nannocystis sp.]|uniref:mechanosensitive ion channel n=1 Tax=Nannocystis sp. TaxID=1962667 RepID=UPI0025FE23C9|nr:mechanosensitive ion channel [Nannocystis sp.]MBK7827669.1 mechanosensitive ion channel [Nannocystis sp.]